MHCITRAPVGFMLNVIDVCISPGTAVNDVTQLSKNNTFVTIYSVLCNCNSRWPVKLIDSMFFFNFRTYFVLTLTAVSSRHYGES